MKNMKSLLLKISLPMILLFILVISVYLYTFNGGISDNVPNWELFISICNWLSISVLTMVNIAVFYRLNTIIAKKEANRFIENKISQTENSLREIRVKYYQCLQSKGIELIVKISSNEDFNEDYKDFHKQLLSMKSSILFSCSDEIKNSTIDAVLDLFQTEMNKQNVSKDYKINCIVRCLRGVEIIILSIPLRDERILKKIKENPEHFDPAFISVDTFISKLS